MKHTAYYLATLAFFVLVYSLGFSEERGAVRKDKTMFSTNLCMAKGGIGVVNKNLHIDLKSSKNELILSAGERWEGQAAQTPAEVVIFFDGKVYGAHTLPPGFDLSNAVVVSFEGDKVRFFDFEKMSGGYYLRSERAVSGTPPKAARTSRWSTCPIFASYRTGVLLPDSADQALAGSGS